MEVILFSLAFITSVVGSICGIGGGVLIKPFLDALNILSVSSISFLSGCTVLTMAIVSVIRNLSSGQQMIDFKITTLLGVGAVTGGMIGQYLFSTVIKWFGTDTFAGFLQAALLAVITLMTLLYLIIDEKRVIPTKRISNPYSIVVVGVGLGTVSAFLGIGGGPINILVLTYFFSFRAKVASINSLCIIVFSQGASLLQIFLRRAQPQIPFGYLAMMCAGGILGAIIGQRINKFCSDRGVKKMFRLLLLIVIGVSVYNMVKFLGLGPF